MANEFVAIYGDSSAKINFMTIKRAVTDIKSDDPKQSREFYTDFLGFEMVMERDEIITFASPDNQAVQISVVRADVSGVPHPSVSIEVTDVDEIHAKAITQGIEYDAPRKLDREISGSGSSGREVIPSPL